MAQQASDSHTDWHAAPLDRLVTFIVQTCHVPLREELPRLVAMARAVRDSAAVQAPAMMPTLVAHLEALAVEMPQHLDREEQQLFPAIVELARGRPEAFLQLTPLVTALERDDQALRERLKALAELTGWFQPPPGCSDAQYTLYGAISRLTEATYLHLLLEHVVLVPRARLMADAAGRPTRDQPGADTS